MFIVVNIIGVIDTIDPTPRVRLKSFPWQQPIEQNNHKKTFHDPSLTPLQRHCAGCEKEPFLIGDAPPTDYINRAKGLVPLFVVMGTLIVSDTCHWSIDACTLPIHT